MSKRVAEAERMFAEGFTCSQSVFGAFAEDLGLEKHMALKLANGFGGGIARRQEVCGAVSGAVMLIGWECKIVCAFVRTRHGRYNNHIGGHEHGTVEQRAT